MLASLYDGWLCFSVARGFSKARFFPRGTENSQFLQYRHAYQLGVHANVKTMYAHARVLWNGVKMETLSHKSDRATKQNVNFLLATTVLLLLCMYAQLKHPEEAVREKAERGMERVTDTIIKY
jgi:hypothetical protein